MSRRSTIILIFLLLITLLFLSACASAAPVDENGQPRLALSDCQLSAPGYPIRMPAQCGKLTVYEDREAGSGRQIELNVAVIPSISRSPEPDPLFFLTGGPGEAATESYLLVSSAFDRILQNREIVLVDQRGTGQSNPLQCLNFDDLETAASFEDMTPYLENCRQALDADLTLYTTSIAMDDLDDVRAALGYEQINLYGVSYGTRAAQTYLQQHGDRVRSVILDGVVPQTEPLGIDVARDAQRALELIFERCAADAACSQEFPSLQEEFNHLIETVRANPVEVSLRHPTSGEMTDVTLDADGLGSAIRLFSYTPETAALLPLLIHTAYTTEDYSLLASQYLLVSDQLLGNISTGMNYSVICAEDVPFLDPQAVEAANQGTYLGDQQTRMLSAICEVWPRGEVPAGFKEPVRSEVPVLLLSGEADPVTPPENAEEVAEHLPNSLHVVGPEQGHGISGRGCVSRLMTDFIESGSVEGLDTSCVQSLKAMPFFLNFAGPLAK